MKRELKDYRNDWMQRNAVASHTIPMKRELKATPLRCRSTWSVSFTHHPDEEGTER